MISRSSQQSQSRLLFSSLVILLIYVLDGCNSADSTSNNPASNTQTQSDTPIPGDTIASGNQAYKARINGSLVYTSGQKVTLDGSSSSGTDRAAPGYQWEQSDVSSIPPSNNSGLKPGFLAPSVAQGTQFSFKLTEHDGELFSRASVFLKIIAMFDTSTPSIILRSPQLQRGLRHV
jgi:hypothetical protein